MQIITDLHIHSGYARACSPQLTIKNIDIWAKKKGIDVISVADFTHPGRFKEMQEILVDQGKGLYTVKGSNTGVHFIMGTEVSCIYRHNDQIRRLHICVFLSSMEKVVEFNKELASRGGKLKSDGRPILGMSAKDILKIVMCVDPEGFVVPAHIWTPWFAIFGSKSGYDSMEECFEELTSEIKAVETGLSSDPPMNWQWSELDHLNLISNSDAHSLPNLGREANIMEVVEMSYSEIKEAVQNKKSGKLIKTIEFYPEEGIYHFDGHRKCGVCLSPEETKRKNGTCPKCGKQLTLGVAYRVVELGDKKKKDIHSLSNFVSIVPLQEIISEAVNVGKHSKKVQTIYEDMIKQGKNEFNILLNLSEKELKNIADPFIVKALMRMRNGKIDLHPGFDGQYGVVKIFSEQERINQQQKLI
jgi:uncharacterized protein (TIGR00375 family)